MRSISAAPRSRRSAKSAATEVTLATLGRLSDLQRQGVELCGLLIVSGDNLIEVASELGFLGLAPQAGEFVHDGAGDVNWMAHGVSLILPSEALAPLQTVLMPCWKASSFSPSLWPPM